MAIPNMGAKAYAGEFTGKGVLKLFLDDDSHTDVPLLIVPGGSVVDNEDGTVTVTI